MAIDGEQRAARRRQRTALACLAAVAGMVGLSFASVPLYDLFCRVTGYGGTTQTAAGVSGEVLDRRITVRFNADVARGMPWSFHPTQRAVSVRVGEEQLAFYSAYNPTDRRIAGTATFNVSPAKAGLYFNKIDCFCFTEQVLAPGASVQMPVSFFIDPAIAQDRGMDEVREITLSYTFFEDTDATVDDTAALDGTQRPGG
ncbi:MAG: cytochrome c oxidase assembly protein [Sneathiellaceae bacterium]